MVGILPGSGIKTVLEPTPGAGNIVKELRGYNKYDICAPNEFWDIDGRFDAVVMNPPFTPMVTGYKILYRVMEMSDIIVALMPWLTIINSEKRTRDIVGFGLKSITHMPRSVFPGSRVQTCILNMAKGYDDDTMFLTIQEDGGRMGVLRLFG